MNKNFKYKNTIVIGFDDIDDPKRKEIVGLAGAGIMNDWVLHVAAYDVLDDKGVEVGDKFRSIDGGEVLTVEDVAYSLSEHKPFAICQNSDFRASVKTNVTLRDLVNTKIWAKMGQAVEGDQDD